MKKFFVLVLSFVSLATVLNAARTTNRRPSSSRGGNTSSVRTYPLPTQDECNVDIDYCFNRYCFDKKTLSEGVYSKCGAEPASQILINVESCLETRAVIKELDLKNGCKNYSYNRVVNLLANKDVIETGLKKNSKECQKATRALQAAKECYALMISSDGSYSLDLYERLDKLCGFEVSGDSYMLNRFFEAGDYGQANLQAISDLEMTGQNTVKRENWRQVVDATLAGYTEIAELACGEEDYKLTKVNDYALDSRDNSAMIALKAQATEIGKQTANRIVNSWFRETDCVNAPLPVGGLYWDYEKGRSPDCKIVCKEGYAIGKNSSECVKVETTTSSSVAFMGFNIGNDFVGQNTLKKAEPVQQVIVSSSSGSGSSSYVPPVGSSICSKETTNYEKWYLGSKGKKAVCDVFCPNAPSMRYYERNTTDPSQEFFCIGDSAGRYHSWYNMTLAELNELFKTNHPRMGNDYATDMSKDIEEYCATDCGNNNRSFPVENSTTSTSDSVADSTTSNSEPPCNSSDKSEWRSYLNSIGATIDSQNVFRGILEISQLKEKYCEKKPEVEEEDVAPASASAGNGCGCEDIPEVLTTWDFNMMGKWEDFATKCDLSACDDGRSVGLSDSIKRLLKAVTNTGTGNMAYGPSISNLRQVTDQVEKCLCKEKILSDNYEKKFRKKCENYLDGEDVNLCVKKVVPAYCPITLSDKDLELCLGVLFYNEYHFANCIFSDRFKKNCFWSYSVEPSELIYFDGDNVYFKISSRRTYVRKKDSGGYNELPKFHEN